AARPHTGAPAMPATDWFDIPVLGSLPPEQAEAKLRELGETDAANALRDAPVGKSFSLQPKTWWPFADRPWQHVQHAFGFVTDRADGTGYVLADAGDARQVKPNAALKGALVKITLDTPYPAAYPGPGDHQVLLDFYAEPQTAEGAELLHFSAPLRVRDRQFAGVRAQPLFVGLKVGEEGVNLRCLTINVANMEDEQF